MDCCLYAGEVSEILISQRRLESVIGQWEKKVELKSFRGRRDQEPWRERWRQGDKMEPTGMEDEPDPRGLERPQVTMDTIEGQLNKEGPICPV